MKTPKISLEQWAALRAVVECGSFAAAAEALNKSQSSISYSINTMQQHLPSPALVLVGRKAELTELGQMLYRQACALLDQALSIDKAALCLADGGQSEIVFAIDALCPMAKVYQTLATFAGMHAYVHIRLLETSLSGTDEALFEGKVDFVLTPLVPVGFIGEPLWPINMIPVVHKSHPLAQQEQINTAELNRHRQIVVRDSGRRREQTVGWLTSEQRWTVSHFASSVQAVMAGLGFAFIPKERIANELVEGDLVPLQLALGGERHLTIYLVQAQQESVSPVLRQMREVFLATR